MKNAFIGVICNRADTAIDDFINVEPILQTIGNEKKKCYIMGDYDTDLLRDDSEPGTVTDQHFDFINSYLL